MAADCGACHTAPGGKPFAGGLAIATPLGTILTTNITPSADLELDATPKRNFRGRYVAVSGAMAPTSIPRCPTPPMRSSPKRMHMRSSLYFTQAVKPVEERALPTELPFR